MSKATKQITRLAQFITDEVPDEPSQSQGAVDTAIRLLRKAYVKPPRRDEEGVPVPKSHRIEISVSDYDSVVGEFDALRTEFEHCNDQCNELLAENARLLREEKLLRNELWRLTLLRDPFMDAFEYLHRVITAGEGMTPETAQVLDNAFRRIDENFS